MQIAATPQRSPDSRSRCASVPRIRPPEAPSGWPIAIAPPLALTISGSTLPGVDAGQRLHGERLVELDRGDVGPGDAGPGERLSAASTGREAEHLRLEREHARGRRRGRAGARPIRAAAASEPSSTADAPSLSGEALPAVIVPSGRNDGFSPASVSGGAAGPDALVAGEVRAGHRRPPGRRRSPASQAASARWCERAANSSCRSREIANRSPQLLVGLAQRDRPLRRHPLVDQPPAQRRRDRGDVAGREGPRRLRQHPRRPGHRLHAAGDARRRRRRTRSVREADHRGVQRRAAEPVDRGRRHADRQPGQQHRHPADVAVVLAGAVGVAPDHVADRGRVEAGRLARARPVRAVAARSSGRTSARAPPNRPNGVRAAAYRKDVDIRGSSRVRRANGCSWSELVRF